MGVKNRENAAADGGDAVALGRQRVVEAFLAGVARVSPDRLIRDHVRVVGDVLTLADERFDLGNMGRILVVGAGKASGLMALELERILGARSGGGAVVVKYGHGVPCRRVEILEAGHPYPDAAGVDATAKIARLCRDAVESDLVICLLSGGGSALLADVPEGSTLEEVNRLSKLLVNSGADIRAINAVRKHVSRVKGGQLARLASPARVVSLILSDVVGDPLDVIASGPTVADPSTFGDAVAVCRRWGIWDQVPETLRRVLSDGAAGGRAETPKPGDGVLAQTVNRLIGTNRLALDACLEDLLGKGVKGEIVTDRMEGDAEVMAARIVTAVLERKARVGAQAPCAMLFGGETTLNVTGSGTGGRSQHLALKAACLLRGCPDVTLLAAGTDGNDGPTDAAGAVVDGGTCDRAAALGLDPLAALRAFDSYGFFQAAGGHLVTGPTRTNVMDVVIALTRERS